MNNEQTTNEVLQLGTLNLTLTPDTYFLMFHDVTNDNKEVGKFFLKDGLFEFEGDATESARIFVEEIKRMFKDSIEQSIAEESYSLKYELKEINRDLREQVQYLTGDIVNLKGKNEKLRKENIELHHCANCWETRFDDGKDSPCISGNKCVNYSHRKGFNNE